MKPIKSKKGVTTDMILYAGLLMIAAFMLVYSIDLFYESVQVSVQGSPVIAAKIMGSYFDFVHASSNPIAIYHEIPPDFLGNPAYGTVLLNPETCDIRVNKFPQDYISEFILNAGFDKITAEEALTAYGLYKWRKHNLEKAAVFGAIDKRAQIEINEKIEREMAEWEAQRTRPGRPGPTDLQKKIARREIEERVVKEVSEGTAAAEARLYRGTIIHRLLSEKPDALGKYAAGGQFFGKGNMKPLVDASLGLKANARTYTALTSTGMPIYAEMAGADAKGASRLVGAADKSALDFVKELGGAEKTLTGKQTAVGTYWASEAALLPESAVTAVQPSETPTQFKNLVRTAETQEAAARLMSKSGGTELEFIAALNKEGLEDIANNPTTRKELQQLFVGAESMRAETLAGTPPELQKNIAQNSDVFIAHSDDLAEQVVKQCSNPGDKACKQIIKSVDAPNVAKGPISKVFGIPKAIAVGVLSRIPFVQSEKLKDLKAARNVAKLEEKAAKQAAKQAAKEAGLPTTRVGKSIAAHKQVITGAGAAAKNVGGRFISAVKNPKAVKNAIISLPKKALTRILPQTVALKALDDAANANPEPFSKAGMKVTAYAWSAAIVSVEYFFTYLPITHFIDRSQDATAAVEKEWGSFSCRAGAQVVKVQQPNCESAPDIDHVRLTSAIKESKLLKGLANAPILGEAFDIVISPLTALEALLQTPSSKPLPDNPKSYKSIENTEEQCADAHNYLLSKEVDKMPTTPNPKHVVATAPFFTCAGIGAAKPDWAPGCMSIWTATYLGMWADPELSVSQIVALQSVGTLLGGPAGTAVVATYLYNPIDSTTFFPYLSKSAGMVDSENYYYIEDPYLITIAKDFDENGNLVMEVNKEL